MERSPYFLESVDRVLQVLECFTPEAPELRLTDISRLVGMPKPQVLRIVSTLETRGYVVRDPVTKRYRLGIRLFHLGCMVQDQFELRTVVRRYLEWLVEQTHETARLVVPDSNGPVCIDVVEGPKSTRVFARLGKVLPWHAGTSPKLLLAYLPDEQREAIIATCDFTPYTALTTTDPDALRTELAIIREQGYHLGERDLDEDASGISGPVFDHTGRIVGAINVSWPAARLREPDREELIELVVRAAREASTELGYLPTNHLSARGSARNPQGADSHGGQPGVPVQSLVQSDHVVDPVKPDRRG